MPVPTIFGVYASAGAVSASTTWSTTDKAVQITLSGGDLTATRADGSGPFYASLRGTSSKSAGKWYFEVICIQNPSPTFAGVGVCVANATAPLNNYLGSTSDGVGYFSGGAVIINSVGVLTMPGYGAGDIVKVALDITNQRIWFKLNGGNWNNNASADPATNTLGVNIAAVTGMLFAGCTENLNVTNEVTINFGATAFNSSPPSGFTAWG